MIVGIPRGMTDDEFHWLGDDLFYTAVEAYGEQLSADAGYRHRFAERTLKWHLDRLALWLLAWEADLGDARDYSFEQAYDDAYEWVRGHNALHLRSMMERRGDVRGDS